MTPQGRQQDQGFIAFSKRVGIVAGAALAVVALSQMLFAQVTRDLRASLIEESRARTVADSLQSEQSRKIDGRLDRMSSIMELVVLVISDQTDPEARDAARTQLRRMRRLNP